MDEPAAYHPPAQPLRQLTEPVATLLRAFGFTPSELFHPDGVVAVVGVWATRAERFEVRYQHDTRTEECTFQITAHCGEYRTSTGHWLVWRFEDLWFLLGSWRPLVLAQRRAGLATMAAPYAPWVKA